ncbi:MAG: hypothetical protein DRN15_01455 [Thermoprotei archaeon]|nr:MAG: hypothetical protein DRN15_01455 [Thermoprotei archaeon]RLF25861.1 MAG: hypothetical protein DRM97_00350 [Thermoprotei archaeon]
MDMSSTPSMRKLLKDKKGINPIAAVILIAVIVAVAVAAAYYMWGVFFGARKPVVEVVASNAWTDEADEFSFVIVIENKGPVDAILKSVIVRYVDTNGDMQELTLAPSSGQDRIPAGTTYAYLPDKAITTPPRANTLINIRLTFVGLNPIDVPNVPVEYSDDPDTTAGNFAKAQTTNVVSLPTGEEGGT